jgi:hypothetical protein
MKAFPLPSVTTLSHMSSSTAPAPTSSSSTRSARRLLSRCTSCMLTGLPLRVCASRGQFPLSAPAFTLLRLSVLVSAIGSDSLLRRALEALADAFRDALESSRAWAARGEIEREEAVVHGFGLRMEGFEFGVLARWLEACRCEGGAVGGGVGDASLGSTHERSCRGRAISSASSISASRSSLELLSEEVSQSSLSPNVERVTARGKFGAKVERIR